jgi:hypothetical protein
MGLAGYISSALAACQRSMRWRDAGIYDFRVHPGGGNTVAR